MDPGPIGTGRLPPLGGCQATISSSIGVDLPIPQKTTPSHGAMVAGLAGGNSGAKPRIDDFALKRSRGAVCRLYYPRRLFGAGARR